MNEMLERTTDAILRRVPEGYGMTRDEARSYALAVMEEMHDPSDEMWDEGKAVYKQGLVDVWHAMIFAAITPTQSQQSPRSGSSRHDDKEPSC